MKGSQLTRGKLPAEGMGQLIKAPADLAPAVEADLHDKGIPVDPAGREYKELWFALSRTSWQSLALVAGDSSGSANDIATSLANVGRLLHETVRTLMPVDTTTYLIAADLLQAIGSTRGTNETRAPKPFGKVIAALPSIAFDPVALEVVAAADVVVICVEIGRTRVSTLRRTIELVGRERIAGCLLIE
jgi:hypothetical protein